MSKKIKTTIVGLMAILGMGCGTSTPEPQPVQACVMSGYLVQGCGCWGYVEFGVSYADGRCCSRLSTPLACAGGCSGGGSPYRVMCD